MDTTPTLRDLWTAYSDGHLVHLRPTTSAGYRSVMESALAELPDRPAGADVAAWFAQLSRKGHTPSGANHILFVLRAVVRRGALFVEGNTAPLLRAVTSVAAIRLTREAAPRCPPADFVSRARGAARNRAELAFLGVAARGPRKDEILGITEGAILFPTGEIRIERQRQSERRKNRVPYVIEVDAETLGHLRWTIDHRDEVSPRSGHYRARRADGFVFPWGETYLANFVARIREHLGDDAEVYLPRGTAWHAFRHRMARDARERGETELEIADRLGDRTTMMARRYTRTGEMRNPLFKEQRPQRTAPPGPGGNDADTEIVALLTEVLDLLRSRGRAPKRGRRRGRSRSGQGRGGRST